MSIFGKESVEKSYQLAKEIYEVYGIDTEQVLKELDEIKVSLHCWQGDDVTGFEEKAGGLNGGGILATGNYKGKARNGEELRQDLEKVLSLLPGQYKVNLHAIYAETEGKVVGRDELIPEYFQKWINWAKEKEIGLDFNPSFFSHELASSGYTLSSTDEDVRNFWIEHGKRSREIAAALGEAVGSPCVNNIWIPDGSKDIPADRMEHRRILRESLDEIFSEKFDKKYILDAVECKLFGIESESYVVGSHEFYMSYAMKNDIMVCLDAGHFHPTEMISDKISSVLNFSEEVLLHVSRKVRWDSDHIVILNDEMLAIAQEIKRCNAYGRVHIALDFFDASVNRITAWVVGTRAAKKAILISLLEPTHLIVSAEKAGNNGDRLALMEEFKMLPFAAVWNKYCFENNIPIGTEWLKAVKEYEDTVLSAR